MNQHFASLLSPHRSILFLSIARLCLSIMMTLGFGDSAHGQSSTGPLPTSGDPAWQSITRWGAHGVTERSVVIDGARYSDDGSGSCRSSDPNERRGKVCLRRGTSCEFVAPGNLEATFAAGATTEGCDEECSALPCIGRGREGPLNLPCCVAKDELWAWSDSSRKVCNDSTKRESCVPQLTSIAKAVAMLADASIACCTGLVRQDDRCVLPPTGSTVTGGGGGGGLGSGGRGGSGSGSTTGGTTNGSGTSSGSGTGGSTGGSGSGGGGSTGGRPPARKSPIAGSTNEA